MQLYVYKASTAFQKGRLTATLSDLLLEAAGAPGVCFVFSFLSQVCPTAN